MPNKDMLKIGLVVVLVMASSSAFAAITGSTVLGGGTYSPSNNVTINAVSDGANYAAKSGHLNGDRTLFTNNSDPKLYWTAKATGTTPATVSGATETVSSWTTL